MAEQNPESNSVQENPAEEGTCVFSFLDDSPLASPPPPLFFSFLAKTNILFVTESFGLGSDTLVV